jgi:hypothetical protein
MGIGVSSNQKKTDTSWMQAAIHLDSVFPPVPARSAICILESLPLLATPKLSDAEISESGPAAPKPK